MTRRYEHANADQQDVHAFQSDCVGKGMASQRGAAAEIDGADYTTFNARTYLQPQLNKAVAFADKDTSPLVDRNPKDFLLFTPASLEPVGPAQRDNTGRKEFIDMMDMPTLTFPSDHALVHATFMLKA